MRLSLYPIYLIDISGCLAMLILSFLCVRQALRLFVRDRENALYTYILWLTVGLGAFCLLRSLGHLVKYCLLFSGQQGMWAVLSPYAGGLITVTFVVIFAATLFFNNMLTIMNRMNEDRRKIRETSSQLLALNRDIESMVAERTRAEFSLQLAHEIRNPVTVIAGLLRRMTCGEKNSREQNRRYRDSILAQTEKLEDLVRKFEELHGQEETPFGLVRLTDLLEECVRMISGEAADKGVDIHFHPARQPLTCRGDGRYLKVAFLHLLRNALEACRRDDSIRIVSESEKQACRIRIEDTGPGIPPEVQEHIFEPFYSTKKGSTGLGLPYVRQIIREHRGRISLRSTPGQGCRVTVTLPGHLEGLTPDTFTNGRQP